MRHSIAFSGMVSILAAALAIATHAAEPKNAAESTPTVPVTPPTNDGEFVVHEWGTFTTFSGSDGVFIDFRPLDVKHSDLPDYVFDRGSFSTGTIRAFSKGRLRGRVRMETPVTYFYTDRFRTVDVHVDFPSGLLTEFYPPARHILPAIDEDNIFGKGELIGNSSLHWGNVDLIPTAELLPNLANSAVREQVTSSIVHLLIPHAADEQHYAAARETDAALVHVRNTSDTQSYFEKFLFYRGVGKFQLPITTHFDGENAVVSNNGELPIRSLILINVDGTTIQATRSDQVNAGQSLPFNGLQTVSQEQLFAMVHQNLVAEGLYEKEAAAMVNTWQQSWFTENGTRVLYTLPGTTTEELLPLHVTPKPQQMLRVMVGRMEVMSPTSEQKMTKAVAESAALRVMHYAEQKENDTNDPYSIPSTIQGFGRMAEPALARVAKIAKDTALRYEAELLIEQFRAN